MNKFIDADKLKEQLCAEDDDFGYCANCHNSRLCEIINEQPEANVVDFACKVGSFIYRTVFGTVTCHKVVKIFYEKTESSETTIYCYDCVNTLDSFYRSEIGKTVFLDEEEARKAFEEMNK